MASMASKENRKKSSNFTWEEHELLTLLVKKHKDVVENKKSGQTTWDMKNSVWTQIEQEFNSHSKSVYRDAQSLKTKFRNMKKECKQKFSANRNSMRRTGGGSAMKVDITNIDLEVKEIMGNAPVVGLPAIHDDDVEEDETQLHQSQLDEIIQIEYVDEMGPFDEVINDKLVVPQIILNSPSTKQLQNHTGSLELLSPTSSIKRKESCQKSVPPPKHDGLKRNWSQYSPAMLEGPVDKKLKVDVNVKKDSGNQHNRTNKKLACSKSQLYEQVMQEKLDFIKLQREAFLEEHELRKKILQIKLDLLQNQQLNSQISLIDDDDDE